MSVPRLRLRRPLSRAIRRGHPWVFRDAVAGRVPPAGTEVAVADERGRVLGRGWAESGPIAVRLLSLGDTPVDAALLAARLDAALALRRRVIGEGIDAFRLVHGEGDRLPGIVCDVYGSCAVLAVDGSAAFARRADVLAALAPVLRRLGIRTIIGRAGLRGDRTVEVLEGPPPPELACVREGPLVLCVDLMRGQKTGLFLDQRESRARVGHLARDARVLDLYAYVGGFSAAAGKGGAAAVTTVDVAAPAIKLARETWAANDLPANRQRLWARDVPAALDELEQAGERFDLVVADPPSFAPSAAARDKALRVYEALHHACLGLLEPGGLLLAASCSSHVDRVAFEGALARAAGKARRVLQVLDRWGAPPDHPRLLAFPEGDYLTCTLARVVD